MSDSTVLTWLTSIWITSRFPLTLAVIFFISLYHVLVYYPTIFFKKHGRKHAFTGLLYLIWISLGFIDLMIPHTPQPAATGTTDDTHHDTYHEPWIPYLLYDIILGLLGTILTLYAAFEFQHKNIKNVASGTLDEHATVTYGEMIEHSFYQVLNLIQILFIHSMKYCVTTNDTSTTIIMSENMSDTHSTTNSMTPGMDMGMGMEQQQRNTILTSIIQMDSLSLRICLLFLVTIPWLLRDMFPINRFSDNYTKIDEKSTSLIRLLYRIKKYQYVFYKHFLLHGLNITIAITGITFGNQYFFRLYWLLLNLSYVMEFFLQTLVKKSFLKQEQMLFLQKILMTASTIAAISVLRYVNIWIAMISLVYNFVHRKHDVYNTMIVCVGYLAVCYTFIPKNFVY